MISSANHDYRFRQAGSFRHPPQDSAGSQHVSSGNHQCRPGLSAIPPPASAFGEWLALVSSFSARASLNWPSRWDSGGSIYCRWSWKGWRSDRRAGRRKKASKTGSDGRVSRRHVRPTARVPTPDHFLTVKVAGVWDVSTNTKLFAAGPPEWGSAPAVHAWGATIVIRNATAARSTGTATRSSTAVALEGLPNFIGVQLAPDSRRRLLKYMHEKGERGSGTHRPVRPRGTFRRGRARGRASADRTGGTVTLLLAHRSHLASCSNSGSSSITPSEVPETAAFVPFLEFQSDPNVHLYDSSLGQKMIIPRLIRRQPEGTHPSPCGPAGLMDAAINAAEALGWPAESIHVERFGAGPRKGDEPFEAVCQRSGKTVQVGATEHLLDCLEHAGLEVPFGCRAGSCGTCGGWGSARTIIHRDIFLSAAERAEGKKMLACISRGKGSLTLDV